MAMPAETSVPHLRVRIKGGAIQGATAEKLLSRRPDSHVSCSHFFKPVCMGTMAHFTSLLELLVIVFA